MMMLGLEVQVMPVVHIAGGCVIGAVAVVIKDTEPYGIDVGIPARKIKESIVIGKEAINDDL